MINFIQSILKQQIRNKPLVRDDIKSFNTNNLHRNFIIFAGIMCLTYLTWNYLQPSTNQSTTNIIQSKTIKQSKISSNAVNLRS